jgi:hypothetical protein
MSEPTFSDAQRSAIASRLLAITEAIDTLRGVGLDTEALSALAAAVAEIEVETGAQLRRDKPGIVQASIAQILVSAAELGPGGMKGYGELGDDASRYLQEQSECLSALADSLLRPAARNTR